MSQTLVVHDNNSLVSLLELNLPTFVGTDVVSKKSFKEAQMLMEIHPGIHLIVCADKLGNENTAELIHQINIKSKKPSDMIIIGEKSSVPASPHIIHLPANAEVKQMVQAAAKLLKVTPKKMMEMEVPDYYPVAANLCMTLKRAPCEIFIQVADNDFQSKFKEGDSVQSAEIKQLIDSGLITLFVHAEKRLKFVNQVSTGLMTRLTDKSMSAEERVGAAGEAHEIAQDEVAKGEFPLSKQTEELIGTTIKTCLDIAKNNPNVAGLLKKLFANRASFNYQHTQLIILLTHHILSKVEWGSTEQKEKLAFVAFFHDICLTTDKLAKYNSDFAVASDESLGMMDEDLVLRHASRAADIVQKISTAPIGADVIIMQHHGMTSGQGFARSFTNSISPLAIVFIVAEEMATHILELEGIEHLSANQEVIFQRLNQKYPRSNYQRIIETLRTLPMS